MKRSSLVLAAAATLLSGCYNNGYYGYTQPTPGPPCPLPSNAVLVYPSNNATGVPDTTSAVYIALPHALSMPANNDLGLVGPPSFGKLLTGGFKSVTYAQIPTPNTVPGYANPVYYQSKINAGLTAASTFNVYWNDLNSNCTTGNSQNFMGAFTTQ
jgi:hypothetical protein